MSALRIRTVDVPPFAIPQANRLALLRAVAVAVALAATAALASSELWMYWVFGIGFGFAFQRSRFCFTAAFRDLFLLRDGRLMKAVLAALAVATLGFTVVMMGQLPRPGIGLIPQAAHISPLGLHLLLGGLLFGFGMVVSGGCVSGSLYRIGEGYTASLAAVVGMLVGLQLANHHWNWWWQFSMERGPVVWLPNQLGYAGAVALTFGLLGLAYLATLKWESGGIPMFAPHVTSKEPPAATVRAALANLGRQVFAHGWAFVVGGVVLAWLNTLLFVYDHPLGVTGELSVWADRLAGVVGLSAPPFLGQVLSGCNLLLAKAASVISDSFLLDAGLVFGAFLAAVSAGEFKLRFPPHKRRYAQAIGGGILMGYGATLGIGCTIGAFFSAIPSLGLNGWVFGLALLAGSYLGVRALRFLP